MDKTTQEMLKAVVLTGRVQRQINSANRRASKGDFVGAAYAMQLAMGSLDKMTTKQSAKKRPKKKGAGPSLERTIQSALKRQARNELLGGI